MELSQEYGEKFLHPSERSSAVVELVEMGNKSLPILEDILSGVAKNKLGIEYRKLGSYSFRFEEICDVAPKRKKPPRYAQYAFDSIRSKSA